MVGPSVQTWVQVCVPAAGCVPMFRRDAYESWRKEFKNPVRIWKRRCNKCKVSLLTLRNARPWDLLVQNFLLCLEHRFWLFGKENIWKSPFRTRFSRLHKRIWSVHGIFLSTPPSNHASWSWRTNFCRISATFFVLHWVNKIEEMLDFRFTKIWFGVPTMSGRSRHGRMYLGFLRTTVASEGGTKMSESGAVYSKAALVTTKALYKAWVRKEEFFNVFPIRLAFSCFINGSPAEQFTWYVGLPYLVGKRLFT